MPGLLRARQVVLAIVALVFVAVAVGATLDPRGMAGAIGQRLEGVDALNEYRAVYVGVWLATAAILLIAARRVRELILGDLGALLVLGQVAGRLVSVALDGAPSAKLWSWFALELVGGVLLLAVRPRA